MTAKRLEEEAELEGAVKKQRCDDKWIDGLLQYPWRDRLTIVSDPRHVLVRGTGTSMWAAGEVLSDYFADNEQLCRGATCLEVGAGTGVVGLTVSHFGAKLVVLTDMARQIPLLRRNAAANSSGEVHVEELDWTIEEQRSGLPEWRGSWSLIVGSDVGYDPDLFEPLLRTLLAQSSLSTNILLALADREEDDEPNVEDFMTAAAPYFEASVVFERRAEPHQSLTKVVQLRKRL